MTPDDIDFPQLWQCVSSQFLLGTESMHGPAHWKRVEAIGLRLAQETGADAAVVRLFALLHDARRDNESTDPLHGRRGAALAKSVRGDWFTLDDARFELLHHAISYHNDGTLHTDATIGTCWDADRLDLFRVGIYPEVAYLSTPAARRRETIRWAVGLLGSK